MNSIHESSPFIYVSGMYYVLNLLEYVSIAMLVEKLCKLFPIISNLTFMKQFLCVLFKTIQVHLISFGKIGTF
jgi:hypothetical protein